MRAVGVGNEILEAAAIEDGVTERRRIAGDVAEAPSGLLAYVWGSVVEELNEGRDGAELDDQLGVSGGSDVGERPC
jgi:hypothetical protein